MPVKRPVSKSRRLRKSKQKKTRVYKRQTKIVGHQFGGVPPYNTGPSSGTQVLLEEPIHMAPQTLKQDVNKQPTEYHLGFRGPNNNLEEYMNPSEINKPSSNKPSRFTRQRAIRGRPTQKNTSAQRHTRPTTTKPIANISENSIRHYWYKAWPDHGVPEEGAVKSLMELVELVLANIERDGKNVVVHCAAGVGRTGTFITLLHLLSKYDKMLNTAVLKKEIYDFVKFMRERRTYMVQKIEQLNFILTTLYNRYKLTDKLSLFTEDEFSKLKKLTYTPTMCYYPPDQKTKKPDIRNKDRYGDIGTLDATYQLYINPDQKQITIEKECDNYINGTYIDKIGDSHIIATQCPIAQTVEDFKNMCINHKVGQIVMLTGLVEDGKEKCYKYFFDNNGTDRGYNNIVKDKKFTTTATQYLFGEPGEASNAVEERFFSLP